MSARDNNDAVAAPRALFRPPSVLGPGIGAAGDGRRPAAPTIREQEADKKDAQLFRARAEAWYAAFCPFERPGADPAALPPADQCNCYLRQPPFVRPEKDALTEFSLFLVWVQGRAARRPDTLGRLVAAAEEYVKARGARELRRAASLDAPPPIAPSATPVAAPSAKSAPPTAPPPGAPPPAPREPPGSAVVILGAPAAPDPDSPPAAAGERDAAPAPSRSRGSEDSEKEDKIH